MRTRTGGAPPARTSDERAAARNSVEPDRPVSSWWSALAGKASVHWDRGSGDEVGRPTGEEHGDAGQVVAHTPALRGRPGQHAVVEPGNLLAGPDRELRVDPSRKHGVDLDVVASPRRRQRLGELHYAALRRSVGRSEGGAEERHHGADIDDLSATLRLHDRVDGAATQEGAGQVGIEDLAPLAERQVLRR